MREESLYVRQLQDILEQCGVYEETKDQMKELIRTSALRNVSTLGEQLNRIYQDLRADCQDHSTKHDEVDSLRGEGLRSGGIIRATVAERAVAAPYGGMKEYQVIQRHADGRYLQQRFGTLNHSDGGQLRYAISKWNQDRPDSEPSHIDVSLDLPGDHRLELSYLCNEYGEPLAGRLRDEAIRYKQAGEIRDTVSMGMVDGLRQFLEDWGLRLSE